MSKTISLKKLYDLRSTISNTQKIVLVTGVFDLIHSEHQKLLQAAKKQGDILLVGLESDQRVRQLKNPHRPFNSIKKRLTNLAQLNIADYVFELPTNLNTPAGREDLIKKLQPHILAVSQNTPNLPEKRRILKLFQGKVKIVLPHNPNISTSKLLATNKLLR